MQKYKTLSDIWQPEKLSKSLRQIHTVHYIKDKYNLRQIKNILEHKNLKIAKADNGTTTVIIVKNNKETKNHKNRMYQFIEHMDTSKNCACAVYVLLLAAVYKCCLIFVFNFFIISQTAVAFS
jgi:hypothetical protein